MPHRRRAAAQAGHRSRLRDRRPQGPSCRSGLSGLPLTLSAYRRTVRTAATSLAPRLLDYRLRRGKEHAARIGERRGEPSAPRLPGPLVWIHGASVGEFIAVMPLIERIRARGFNVLVTTGTVTSAALAEKRLPPGAVHQFMPIDLPAFVDSLPRLLAARPRLVRRIRPVAEHDHVRGRARDPADPRQRADVGAVVPPVAPFPQDDRGAAHAASTSASCAPTDDAERFGALGAPRIATTGNLKLDAPALPVDHTKMTILASATQGRTIVAAASTHPGEESAIIDAHRRLTITFPGLLTIIAPRHPQRGPAIADIATDVAAAVGAALARRTAGRRGRHLPVRHPGRARPRLSARADRVHGRLAGPARRPESDRGGQARSRHPARTACGELQRDL